MDRSTDVDTKSFDTDVGNLQGDIMATYLFIFNLDYISLLALAIKYVDCISAAE